MNYSNKALRIILGPPADTREQPGLAVSVASTTCTMLHLFHARIAKEVKGLGEYERTECVNEAAEHAVSVQDLINKTRVVALLKTGILNG